VGELLLALRDLEGQNVGFLDEDAVEPDLELRALVLDPVAVPAPDRVQGSPDARRRRPIDASAELPGLELRLVDLLPVVVVEDLDLAAGEGWFRVLVGGAQLHPAVRALHPHLEVDVQLEVGEVAPRREVSATRIRPSRVDLLGREESPVLPEDLAAIQRLA